MNQEKYKRAKEKALHFITDGREFPLDDLPVIIDELTIHKEWGWVFFFNGSKYLSAGDGSHSYIGNRPIVYDLDREEIFWLRRRPLKSTSELIEDYENRRLL